MANPNNPKNDIVTSTIQDTIPTTAGWLNDLSNNNNTFTTPWWTVVPVDTWNNWNLPTWFDPLHDNTNLNQPGASKWWRLSQQIETTMSNPQDPNAWKNTSFTTSDWKTVDLSKIQTSNNHTITAGQRTEIDNAVNSRWITVAKPKTPTDTWTTINVQPTTTPKKETPKPDVNAVNAAKEDVKSKQIANQNAQDAQNQTGTQNTLTSFTNAVNSGNLDTAREIAIANPNLKWDLNNIVTEKFKNEANTKYFTKYNGMSNDNMLTSVKSWDLVPWSERYNLLPPEQRARFEQFQKEKDVIDSYKKTDHTATEKVLSQKEYIEWQKAIFSSNSREKYNEIINSKEIVDSSKKIKTIQDKINQNDTDYFNLEWDIKKQYPNIDWPQLRAMMRNRGKDILREKRALTGQLRWELWVYKTLKDNANVQLNLIKFDDQQNKAVYMNALNQYENRRKFDINRQDKFDMVTFQAQNREIAADNAFSRRKSLLEFQNTLSKDNRGGKYTVDRQGREIYLKNGVAHFVTTDNWEIVQTKTKADYKDSTFKKDWVYTTVRTYDDGRAPDYYTHDINGKKANNWNSVVDSLVSGVSWDLQCWEAVNKYVTGQLWISSKDFWVWDTYASKKKYINADTPSIWGLAMWNNTQTADGKYAENGHIWIVTWYNPNKGTVEITDWNWKGDKKKSTHDVKLSEITNNDGWFYSPPSIPKAVWYETADTPLYKKFLWSKWLTSTDMKSIKDFDKFKAQAELYQKDLTTQWTPQIEKLIKLATDLRDNDPWRLSRVAAWAWWTYLSWDLADYQSNFDAFISNTALDNLIRLKSAWATFGALSNQELEFIKSSSTSLRSTLSEDGYKKELDRIITTLKTGLSPDRNMQTDVNNTVDIQPNQTWTTITNKPSLLDLTTKTIDTSDFNTLINK